MAKEYKDIKGNVLSHGDKVLTIKTNDRARGGDLVEAYFFVNDKGNGFLSLNNNPDSLPSYSLYKQNFEDKVFKL